MRETVLTQGDHYLHLADLTSYSQAQERLSALYADPSSPWQKPSTEERLANRVEL